MKKKVTVLMAFFLCLIPNLATVNASDVSYLKVDSEGREFPDEFESYEHYRNVPDYYTEEHQQELANKIADSENYLEQRKKMRAGKTRKLDVPLHYQIKSYYCGPAVAEMIIDYKLGLGKSPNQETLADEGKSMSTAVNLKTALLGYTNVGDLARVLKKYTGANYQSQNVNEYALANALITDIDAGFPLALNPRTDRFTEYLGDKLQHFQVANGYSYEFSGSQGYDKLFYLDSFKDNRYPKAYGRHSIRISEMEKALKDNYGLYIW